MAVAVLGSVGAKTYQNSVTTKDYTFTVASGSNRAIVLTLNFGGAVTGISATWDQGGTNQAMTSLAVSTGGGHCSAIFGLRAPTVVTNGTLRVSWTTTSEVFIDAIAFSGVDQTSDAAAFPHTATGNNVATLTVTSATGNMVVGCEASGTSQGTTTGTLIYDDHASGAIINAMAQYDNGAASVSIGNSTIGNSNLAAVDVAAAAAGGTVHPWWQYTAPMMGSLAGGAA